jgi:GT2 family glycosyltransferase
MIRMPGDGQLAVIIATRNRRASLEETLTRLTALPEKPSVVAVDNGSTDGTADMVQSRFPSVRLHALSSNLGGAARTIGVAASTSRYVAFSDDDSFWAPGALDQACRLLDDHDRLGLIAGQVRLGEAQRPDPVCHDMESSPLGRVSGSYPRVLGFIACGAVMRRSAYLEAGGFHPRFGIGGEEELLALDLATRGWQLAYASQVVARHFPSPARDITARRAIVTRNALWVSWLRDAPRDIGSRTGRALSWAGSADAARTGMLAALAGLPWIRRERHRLPPAVAAARRRLMSN